MTELTNSIGVLVRVTSNGVAVPTSCSVCGCTWGIRDQLIPNLDPYVLAGYTQTHPKTISCGHCGRLLE